MPTAANQVYGGVRLEQTRSNKAVDQTANEVVMADGKVANTFFFTIGGGYTENNENVWVSSTGKVTAAPIRTCAGSPTTTRTGWRMT